MAKVAGSGVTGREVEDPFVSIGVAGMATLISFTIASGLFVWRSAQFEKWRQVRTEFAFSPPLHDYLAIFIFVAVGAIAIRERQWIAPVGIGTILSYLTIGGVAYSGPGYLFQAVQPLMEYGMEMLGLALLLNSAILIVWICLSKKRSG